MCKLFETVLFSMRFPCSWWNRFDWKPRPCKRCKVPYFHEFATVSSETLHVFCKNRKSVTKHQTFLEVRNSCRPWLSKKGKWFNKHNRASLPWFSVLYSNLDSSWRRLPITLSVLLPMYKIETYCAQGLEKYKTFLLFIILWGDFTQLFFRELFIAIRSCFRWNESPALERQVIQTYLKCFWLTANCGQ